MARRKIPGIEKFTNDDRRVIYYLIDQKFRIEMFRPGDRAAISGIGRSVYYADKYSPDNMALMKGGYKDRMEVRVRAVHPGIDYNGLTERYYFRGTRYQPRHKPKFKITEFSSSNADQLIQMIEEYIASKVESI